MEIPFVGGAYESDSVNANAQRCVNLYPEVDELSAKNNVVLYGTPGLSELVDLPFSVIPPPDPGINPVAALILEPDSTPLSSTLTSEPALIDEDSATSVSGIWDEGYSYGLDFGEEVTIDGIQVWTYYNNATPVTQWGTYRSIEAYVSSDNVTWTLIRFTLGPAFVESEANSFSFIFYFDEPTTGRYFKIHNIDTFTYDALTVAGNYQIEITEMDTYKAGTDTPTVQWSDTEQSSYYDGAQTNPIVAIQKTGVSTGRTIIANTGRNTGKYYFEILPSGTNNSYKFVNSSFGIRLTAADSGVDYERAVGGAGCGVGYFGQGRWYRNGALIYNDAGYLSYEVVLNWVFGCYVDLDNLQMWFTRNGVMLNDSPKNGDPETGTDPAVSSIPAGTYYPACSGYYSLAQITPDYNAFRLHARADNILHLPEGSIFSPWED